MCLPVCSSNGHGTREIVSSANASIDPAVRAGGWAGCALCGTVYRCCSKLFLVLLLLCAYRQLLFVVAVCYGLQPCFWVVFVVPIGVGCCFGY